MSHSSKLTEPKEGIFGTSNLYAVAQKYRGQPGLGRAIVGRSPELWDMILSLGRQCQKQIALYDTELSCQRIASYGDVNVNHSLRILQSLLYLLSFSDISEVGAILISALGNLFLLLRVLRIFPLP